MFWGAFCYHGLGPLISLKGRITGVIYTNILKSYAIPTLQKFYPRKTGILQDNAPVHRAQVTAPARKNIRTLKWPAQSPDLNPIEDLWKIIKTTVAKRTPRPSSLTMLEKYVQEAWADIPPEDYRSLVDSMPRRIQAVIDANGGHTKY
jgi:transposase